MTITAVKRIFPVQTFCVVSSPPLNKFTISHCLKFHKFLICWETRMGPQKMGPSSNAFDSKGAPNTFPL